MYQLPNPPVLLNRDTKDPMPYTLVNAQGTIKKFYVLAIAEMYQQIEGGQILNDQATETVH